MCGCVGTCEVALTSALMGLVIIVLISLWSRNDGLEFVFTWVGCWGVGCGASRANDDSLFAEHDGTRSNCRVSGLDVVTADRDTGQLPRLV